MQTLSGNGKLLAAARHNKRVIQREIGAAGHIDATKMHLNYALLGDATPEAVAAKAKSILQSLGITKLRKNAVSAIEIVCSLPVRAQIDHRAYFTDCQAWAAGQFGADNLLTVDVHLDEAAPHCHILLLPLLGGRMRGSEVMGDRKALQARQTSFYEQVSQRYRLLKPQSTRLSPEAKKRATSAVLAHIRATNDAVQKSSAWALVRDLIAHEPMRWAECLGVEIESSSKPKQARTMAQIFTSKGKGAQKEKPANKTPIGNLPAKNTNPYLCVGVSSKSCLPTATKEPVIEVRERESDCTLDNGYWDENTGEYVKVTPRVQTNKLEAQRWVKQALGRATRSRQGGTQSFLLPSRARTV
jgi:Plasmid recombination enzyme